VLQIGIAGCGRAARIPLDQLVALAEVTVVGCADSDRSCAESLASEIGQAAGPRRAPAGVFTDHRELLRRLGPDALCIFTPHFWHYRLAMGALQAGSHVFIQKPLSTNIQEAADIVGLARGRSFKVATPGCRPIQKANRSRNFGSDLEETSRAANDPGGDRPQPGNLDT
jgi:predicted dehydrogenase